MGSVLHGFVCLVCTVLGVSLAFATSPEFQEAIRDLVGMDPRFSLAVLMGGMSYLFGATFAYEFDRWFEDVLPRTRIRDVIWGAVGTVGGMLVANLILLPLIMVMNASPVHEAIVSAGIGGIVFPVVLILLPITGNLFLGYLGAVLLIRKENELEGLLLGVRDPHAWKLGGPRRLLVDTSAIIDGRIRDLLELGLVEGPVVVPRFVLNELQLLADSSDDGKRQRGRRGLDILEDMLGHLGNRLLMPDTDFEDCHHVDEKLIRLARQEPAQLVTNDYNLAKIAGLEGIESLSLHALADAMRPVALPGDRLEVEVIKPGKEKDQGVGYLGDGSMVVVRDGADRLGELLLVHVERVLQTSAGRMIFAREVAGGEPSEDAPIPLTRA